MVPHFAIAWLCFFFDTESAYFVTCLQTSMQHDNIEKTKFHTSNAEVIYT